MSLLLLSLIGIIESVVYLLRYRTANAASHWISGLLGFAGTPCVFHVPHPFCG